MSTDGPDRRPSELIGLREKSWGVVGHRETPRNREAFVNPTLIDIMVQYRSTCY